MGIAWHPDRFMEWCVADTDLDDIDLVFGK